MIQIFHSRRASNLLHFNFISSLVKINSLGNRENLGHFTWKRNQRALKLLTLHLESSNAVMTGDCLIGKHAQVLGLPYIHLCRRCKGEEEKQSTEHLFNHCSAFGDRRLRWFVRRTKKAHLVLIWFIPEWNRPVGWWEVI